MGDYTANIDWRGQRRETNSLLNVSLWDVMNQSHREILQRKPEILVMDEEERTRNFVDNVCPRANEVVYKEVKKVIV